MKAISSLVLFVAVMTVQSNAFAEKGDGKDPFKNLHAQSNVEIVKWIGEVKDRSSSHTTEHKHKLEFVRKDDGKEFDIVDSPELVKLHHETEKNYLVEVEAEKTPKFLFWGGNLIVKNFKVLEETSGVLPHLEIKEGSAKSVKFDRGAAGRN